uniref:Putative angio-associated migratory cell protein n=1 Tax=Amblyomma cajennense TaxID=34607 RepID=A0A023FL40_AMBCJ
MRCDTPPRMEDVNDRDSSDDDAPADMDDIEIVEVYEDGASDLSDEEEEGAGGNLLEEEEDDVPLDEAAVSFSAHRGSAFVCAVSGNGQYLVTGGEDDRGCVWRLDSGELVFACGGHTDSVTGAAFNHDSTLVATADMSGSVHVWSVETQQSVCDLDMSTDLNWIDWHRQANVLLAGTADGTVWMWQVPSGQCKTMQGPGVSCGVGRVLADGRRAAAGYDDGSVRVWDLKGSSVTHSLVGPNQTHPAAVTCLDAGGELVATAATDVRLLHAGTGRLLATLGLNAGGGDDGAGDVNTVEALSLDGQQRTLAAGVLSGRLSLWDLGALVEKQSCPHPAGVTRALWRGPHTVVTGCLDGVVRAWDARTGQPTVSWKAHRHDILDLALSPDGQCVVSVSDGGTCTVHRFASPD